MAARILRYLRWFLGGAIGGAILLYFFDFAGWLPMEMHALLHIQVVPAILAGTIVVLAVTFLATLLFGRVYCSVVCPLGILQDFISRCKIWWTRIAKKGKKVRMKYEKPLNILRYGIFFITALCFVIGISFPLLLLDPYSNFGRITVSLFKPVVVWINNIIAGILTARGNYTLYNVYIENSTWLVLAAAVVVFVALAILAWRKERIWCNTICPVGTLLGFVSRFSLFRITLNSNCTGCKQCAAACKSRCIEITKETRSVDYSRCVTCFNCLGKCKFEAMSYAPTGWTLAPKTKNAVVTKEAYSLKGKPAVEASAQETQAVNGDGLTSAQVSRRRFVKGTLMAAAMIPAAKTFAQEFMENAGNGGELQRPTRHPLPPGAGDLERFRSKCTACQLCISKCPSQVLQPAFLENGLTGIMQPYLKFRLESYCSYDCKVCIDVCPNHALQPMTLEEKKLTKIGQVHFLIDKCIVKSELQDCGACAEHCPSKAVRMVPFGVGTLTIPELTPELCIGCGGCTSICPVTPEPAIFVDGYAVQEMAVPPTDEKIDVDADALDFGF